MNKFLFTLLVTSLCLLIFIVKTFAQEEYNTQTFKMSKGGTLRTEISGGDIHVKTGNDNEVRISSIEDEDYREVIIHQEGNNITIRSDNYVDFAITVPSEFNLSLNTSGGDIKVINNIKGKVKTNTSGGDISLKDVNGELSANTSGGDIKCGDVNGDAKLTSSGGDIVVGSVEGECKLSTGGGDVTVKKVTKSLSVSTGGGNVKSGNVGDDVKIITGGGDVNVDNISGVLKITTGGGNISGTKINKGGIVVTGAGDVVLKNLSGDITVTSGAGNLITEFLSTGNKESRIVTGYGDITIYIPENAKVTVEAKVKAAVTWNTDKDEISEFISSDFKASNEDFNQKKGEFKAVYNINGGGTKIQLETSLGNIQIKKLKR